MASQSDGDTEQIVLIKFVAALYLSVMELITAVILAALACEEVVGSLCKDFAFAARLGI